MLKRASELDANPWTDTDDLSHMVAESMSSWVVNSAHYFSATERYSNIRDGVSVP